MPVRHLSRSRREPTCAALSFGLKEHIPVAHHNRRKIARKGRGVRKVSIPKESVGEIQVIWRIAWEVVY